MTYNYPKMTELSDWWIIAVIYNVIDGIPHSFFFLWNLEGYRAKQLSKHINIAYLALFYGHELQ